jgi:hypothetical protein
MVEATKQATGTAITAAAVVYSYAQGKGLL